jgi:DNA repair exonuclease SbcCD nuclease subunit
MISVVKNILMIGDVHAKLSDLDEIRKLVKWILEYASANGITHVVFMGDIHDTHALARVEVADLWQHTFASFKSNGIAVYLIAGNHDMDQDCRYTWIDRYKDQVTESTGPGLDRSFTMFDGVGALPYSRDHKAFLEAVNGMVDMGVEVIFCHQDFIGAEYGNGFAAIEGVDINDLPPKLKVISGHIHKRQTLHGKNGQVVEYIGTPRYMDRNDIGETKGIWQYTLLNKHLQFVPVPFTVSEPFVQVNLKEGEEVLEFKKNIRYFVDLHGSKEFISKAMKKIPDSVKVRTFPSIEKRASNVNEKAGIPIAFREYLRQALPQQNLTNKQMAQVAKILSNLMTRVS